MESDLQKLHRLLGEGYKLIEIHFSFDKSKEPQELFELTLEKSNNEILISSSENELISYAIHLHSIPHIDDEGSDFVYVEDTNKYFDLQKSIVDLFTGEKKDFIVCERRLKGFQEVTKKIVTFEKNWILSEKNVAIENTKLCQIFYDIGVLLLRGKNFEFQILRKEKISLAEIQSLLSESQKADLAICFSAFVIGPKAHSKKKGKNSDLIVGILVYDLKNRQTLSFNLNSLWQLQHIAMRVGTFGLWESVFSLFETTKCEESFRSFLPLPLNFRNFTPLPWFCVAFIKGIREEIKLGNVKIDLPLFLAFGTPLLLYGKPSYDFDAEKQRALIMLGFRENNQNFSHQMRFDISKGEPNLHIDYQIFPENGPSYKTVGHSVVNYKEIWDFNENLAIGFLLASAYDINFERIVVPNGLSGIEEAFRNNPLTVFPLFVRSLASRPFSLVKKDVRLIEALLQLAKRETVEDIEAVKNLHELGLVKDGRLTILGDIVFARILQTENKSSV